MSWPARTCGRCPSSWDGRTCVRHRSSSRLRDPAGGAPGARASCAVQGGTLRAVPVEFACVILVTVPFAFACAILYAVRLEFVLAGSGGRCASNSYKGDPCGHCPSSSPGHCPVGSPGGGTVRVGMGDPAGRAARGRAGATSAGCPVRVSMGDAAGGSPRVHACAVLRVVPVELVDGRTCGRRGSSVSEGLTVVGGRAEREG